VQDPISTANVLPYLSDDTSGLDVDMGIVNTRPCTVCERNSEFLTAAPVPCWAIAFHPMILIAAGLRFFRVMLRYA
jgi:hypothetical protein